MYVFGAEVARLMSSLRKRGDGDLVEVASITNGCRAARALGCAWSILRLFRRSTAASNQLRQLCFQVVHNLVMRLAGNRT